MRRIKLHCAPGYAVTDPMSLFPRTARISRVSVLEMAENKRGIFPSTQVERYILVLLDPQASFTPCTRGDVESEEGGGEETDRGVGLR